METNYNSDPKKYSIVSSVLATLVILCNLTYIGFLFTLSREELGWLGLAMIPILVVLFIINVPYIATFSLKRFQPYKPRIVKATVIITALLAFFAPHIVDRYKFYESNASIKQRCTILSGHCEYNDSKYGMKIGYPTAWSLFVDDSNKHDITIANVKDAYSYQGYNGPSIRIGAVNEMPFDSSNVPALLDQYRKYSANTYFSNRGYIFQVTYWWNSPEEKKLVTDIFKDIQLY